MAKVNLKLKNNLPETPELFGWTLADFGRDQEGTQMGSRNLVASTTSMVPKLSSVSETCVSCQEQLLADETPNETPNEIDETAESPVEETDETLLVDESDVFTVAWSGVLVTEGEMTGDGRFIEVGALTWQTPTPFRYVSEDIGGHDGAIVSGRIDKIERIANSENGTADIVGSGVIFLDNPKSLDAAKKIASEQSNGVSVDLDSTEFEVRVSKKVWDAQQERLKESQKTLEDDDEPAPEIAKDGSVILYKQNLDDSDYMAITSARIRSATQVAIPAFINAKVYLTEDLEEKLTQLPTLTASLESVPNLPPASWFENPKLSEPTPLTLDDDGHIYGHLATWNSCHIGYSDRCVTPPRSAKNYEYFHLGEVETFERTRVPVGHITLDTGHAASGLNAGATISHYDNTGTVVADIAVGEDSVGIWFNGAVRVGVDESTERKLRSSSLSGDWRGISNNLELVAALAVNVPGFPVPRPAGLVACGELMSLVAVGVVSSREADEAPSDSPRYLADKAETEVETEAENEKAKLSTNQLIDTPKLDKLRAVQRRIWLDKLSSSDLAKYLPTIENDSAPKIIRF